MTMCTWKCNSKSVISVTRLLALREGGLRNNKNADFRLSRLQCYNYPVISRRDLNFRERVDHSNPYENWIYNCKFAECPGAENILACSRANGWLTVSNSYNDADSGNGKGKLHQVSVEHNAIVDFAWMPNDLKLVSGSADGKLTFWHINSPYVIPDKDFFCHKFAVRTVCFSKHKTCVFASGGQIGEIFLYDCRSGAKPTFSIVNAHDEVDDKLYYFDEDLYYHEGKSVTGLAFQNEHTLFSCTFGKRIIKAWDLRQLKRKLIDKPEYKYSLILHSSNKSSIFHGFTSLSIDPMGEKLYARCSNQSIYAYDVSTTASYFPTVEYKTENVRKFNYDESITIKANLSPDGKHLICSSNSDTAHIWNTSYPGKPIAKLTSHGDVIKSCDWSRTNHMKIATYMKKDCVRLWQDEIEVNKKIKGYRD